MVVRAAEAGWRIAETAVPYYPREGKSKVTGTVRGTARTVKDMRRVLASITPAPAPAPAPIPTPSQAPAQAAATSQAPAPALTAQVAS
jgi:dTDP-L-rhamnose 4-epimerase